MLDLHIASIASFVITFILGIFVIPLLTRLKFGQTVREDGPRRHLKKSGTPTMGGLIFLPAIALTSLVVTRGDSKVLVAVLSMLGFGAIGFIDDYIKTSMKRSLGLRANQKLSLQIILALGISLFAYYVTPQTTHILLPFLSTGLDLGVLFIPFNILVIIATVNSVNIADGLDGLVSGIVAIICFTFIFALIILDHPNLSLFNASIVGGCLGFLIYNFHPAKVFMGDTGSLGLGGALSAVLVLSKTQLFILIFGLIFVIEALSVIIQVVSFQLTGHRIFKMSPLHHHFELEGWEEKQVVLAFWGFTVLTCLIGYFVFFP